MMLRAREIRAGTFSPFFLLFPALKLSKKGVGSNQNLWDFASFAGIYSGEPGA
jgi:hypothetical protein